MNDDQLHDLRELIQAAIHAVVDAATSQLSEEDDMNIRQLLTDQFRFWRR